MLRAWRHFATETVALRAGRLMLGEIANRVRRGSSFAFETTLSGLSYARAIPEWQRAGYHVKLIFLSLPSAEFAAMRVAARVAQGGHDVSPDVIWRRFNAGVRNFHGRYCVLVDAWVLYDNSGTEPLLLASGDRHE